MPLLNAKGTENVEKETSNAASGERMNLNEATDVDMHMDIGGNDGSIRCSPLVSPVDSQDNDDSRESSKLVIDESNQDNNNKKKNEGEVDMGAVIEIIDDLEIENTKRVKQMESLLPSQSSPYSPLPTSMGLHSDIEIIDIEGETDINGRLQWPTSSEESSTNHGGKAADSSSSRSSTEDTAKVASFDKDQKLLKGMSAQLLKTDGNDSILNNHNQIIRANGDDEDVIFYNKRCASHDCPRQCKQFVRAASFALSYYKVERKNKYQVHYLCWDCNLKSIEIYESLYQRMASDKPMLLMNGEIDRKEIVEITDSSEEEMEEGEDEIATNEQHQNETSNNGKKTITRKSTGTKNTKISSAKALNLIENELFKILEDAMKSEEVHKQLCYTHSILKARVNTMMKDCLEINQRVTDLQSKAKEWHNNLYSITKIKVKRLKPLDLPIDFGPDLMEEEESEDLPKVGPIERPPITLNDLYYVVKNNVASHWVPCKVMEIIEGSLSGQMNTRQYKVKFLRTQFQMTKIVSAKNLAYFDAPSVRLSSGDRVIAFFDSSSLSRGKEKISGSNAFYPGVIGETLRSQNNNRYLIFYDDGYTQYVYHRDVRLVCQVSEKVYDDVPLQNRTFLEQYFNRPPNQRPMVQTQIGQMMFVQWNGLWMEARVIDIDCNLLLMQFEGQSKHAEWIYRGSLRLGPLFKEHQKANNAKKSMNTVRPMSCLQRRTETYVRYALDDEYSVSPSQLNTYASMSSVSMAASAVSSPLSSSPSPSHKLPGRHSSGSGPRHVAKKTLRRNFSMSDPMGPPQDNHQQSRTKPAAAPVPAVKHLNNSTIYVEDENKPRGKIVYYMARRKMPPRKYVRHQCTKSCVLSVGHSLRGYSPLAKPLLSGWERLIVRQKIKRMVAYRAPCGKMMRNIKEVYSYLKQTQNPLHVDCFDFSPDTNCLAEYVIESAIVHKNDISGGLEEVPIPLVNYYDNTLPQKCIYSTKVIPTEGVYINKELDFLVGCDCEDDCSDKKKCACWQLTLEGATSTNPYIMEHEVGYQYKRLMEQVPTGIYECNARCKCKSNCLNRVVQNSLQLKLQVFKTSNRGWGLRCVNDIPRGTFVCIYAGHLLTETKANEGGLEGGDEYFAELDYIEVAEQVKEGYESEAVTPPSQSSNSSDQRNRFYDDSSSSKSTNHRRSSDYWSVDEDITERQAVNFDPNANLNDSVRESSVRRLFGKDEACYVMDAKIMGNVGRYFNHSCSPNLFVQNVFVDTHDVRFPWVAFFAAYEIRAGTELTWNYNYEVGVVPGKVLYCQCGASNCRLRLL